MGAFQSTEQGINLVFIVEECADVLSLVCIHGIPFYHPALGWLIDEEAKGRNKNCPGSLLCVSREREMQYDAAWIFLA